MAANVRNYISAGNAAVNKAVQARRALAENKARMDEIGMEAVAQDAKTRVNTAANNASTAKQSMLARTNKELADIEIETDKAIAKSKRGARKAGMLAGGVAMLGVGAMQMNKKEEPNEMLSMLKKMQEVYKQREADARSKVTKIESETYTPPKSSTETAPVQEGDTTVSTQTTVATGLRLAEDLIKQGYSKAAAAAIAGNAQHESADFTAHEEFEPNSYGTKGVGFLQWTNAGGGNRRSEFEQFVKSKGYDPKSYQASADYILHELAGGQHWTGGMDTQSFKGSTNLQDATKAFMDHYLRPNKDYQHFDRRLSNAQAIFSQLN